MTGRAVKRDDLFVRSGVEWRRQWVGDNAGRYEWSSGCGRMKVWRSGRIYVTCVDGQVFQAPQATLLGAMNAAFHASVYRVRASGLEAAE